jgi:hypothetical protein
MRSRTFGAVVTTTLLMGFALASTASAAGPYEPNDSIPSAAGPMYFGQTYAAAVEIPADRDFFYFYVTSSQPASVGFSLTNQGGGTSVSDVDLTVFDASATPVARIPFVGQGEDRAATFELKPQKYFVEIMAREGFGDSYSVTTSGSAGAFGSYEQIATRCAKATASVKASKTALERAAAQLVRAGNRVRRSRYSSQRARRLAHSLYRQATVRRNEKRDTLRAVSTSQSPWCDIQE